MELLKETYQMLHSIFLMFHLTIQTCLLTANFGSENKVFSIIINKVTSYNKITEST